MQQSSVEIVSYTIYFKFVVKLFTLIIHFKERMRFRHRENCLFGFQFRKNETIVFDVSKENKKHHQIQNIILLKCLNYRIEIFRILC